MHCYFKLVQAFNMSGGKKLPPSETCFSSCTGQDLQERATAKAKRGLSDWINGQAQDFRWCTEIERTKMNLTVGLLNQEACAHVNKEVRVRWPRDECSPVWSAFVTCPYFWCTKADSFAGNHHAQCPMGSMTWSQRTLNSTGRVSRAAHRQPRRSLDQAVQHHLCRAPNCRCC